MCPIQALLWPFSLAGQASCNYLLAPLDFFLFFWGASVSFNESTSERRTHTHTEEILNHCLKNWLHCGKGLGRTNYHLTEWQLVRRSCLMFTVDIASSIVHYTISSHEQTPWKESTKL